MLQLQKFYESIVVTLEGPKDTFYVGTELSAQDIIGLYENNGPSEQFDREKVPAPVMLGFLNMFLEGALSCGINNVTMQPELFYNHRPILDMQVWIPQDIYIIYLEDDIIRGDFGEIHSRILRNQLKPAP